MDAEILSRIQFGFTVGFHILFPSLNLGLAIFLCVVEGMWLKTHNAAYLRIAKFWTKIFALTFGMGVVSGIVLAYEISTNFGPFIRVFGEVLGALFAYETLTAFFLEAGFLGIMLFGWKRLPPKIHYTATIMVALGTTFSAFWIMSANSWMQTPAGHYLEGDQYNVVSWLGVVFNPSFIVRMLHMLLAAYVTTAFVLAGVASWYLLKGRHQETAKPVLKIAIIAAAFVVPLQIFMGDLVGIKMYQYQPLKTAAMEAVWETQKGAPFVVFAWPDQETQSNKYAITIPKLASLINTHQLDGELIGLTSVPIEDQPPVAPVFFSFRIMVGIGLLFLFITLTGIYLLAKKRLYTTRWFQKLCVASIPLGFVAVICGWLTAEMGRQPWTVYHLMRTSEAVSVIEPHEVLTTLILFILVYGVIFSFYLYYMLKLIRRGPLTLDKTEIEHHLFQYMTTSTERATS